MKDRVTWSLSINQANYIFKLLAQRPFAEVNELINMLAAQSSAEPAPLQEVPKEPEAA